MTRAKREGGQATVELALLLPVLAVLLLAVLQVAAVARDGVLVTHAAREAARAAAVDPDPTAATAAARRAGGLSPDNLRVRVERPADGRVKVTIRYQSDTAVPIIGPLLPPIDHSASASMRVEW